MAPQGVLTQETGDEVCCRMGQGSLSIRPSLTKPLMAFEKPCGRNKKGTEGNCIVCMLIMCMCYSVQFYNYTFTYFSLQSDKPPWRMWRQTPWSAIILYDDTIYYHIVPWSAVFLWSECVPSGCRRVRSTWCCRGLDIIFWHSDLERRDIIHHCTDALMHTHTCTRTNASAYIGQTGLQLYNFLGLLRCIVSSQHAQQALHQGLVCGQDLRDTITSAPLNREWQHHQ